MKEVYKVMRSIKGDNMKMWKRYSVYINGRLMVEGLAPTTLQDGLNTRFQRLQGIVKNSTIYGKLSHVSNNNGKISLYMVQ